LLYFLHLLILFNWKYTRDKLQELKMIYYFLFLNKYSLLSCYFHYVILFFFFSYFNAFEIANNRILH